MKAPARLYRRAAPFYDPVAIVWEGIRRAALRRLPAAAGGVVLDLACGTGLSFAPLAARLRPAALIGADRSDEMLRRAARRAGQGATLVRAVAEALPLASGSVDLVFCCLAHDVVAAPSAMREAVRILKPGGRLVLAGVCLSEGPLRGLVNSLVRLGARLALAAPLTSRPWQEGGALLGGMTVRRLRLGTAYVAIGVKRA